MALALLILLIGLDVTIIVLHGRIGQAVFAVYRSIGLARDREAFLRLWRVVFLSTCLLILGVLVFGLVAR